MGDANTRCPVLRLHQESTADLQFARFLVRMPVDDEIDSRNLSRNPRRNIFAWKSSCHCVVARRLIETRMGSDHNYVRARRLDLGYRRADCRNDVAERDLA